MDKVKTPPSRIKAALRQLSLRSRERAAVLSLYGSAKTQPSNSGTYLPRFGPSTTFDLNTPAKSVRERTMVRERK